MLTYNLVQPSFAFLKVSSLFGAIPLTVESSSGTLHVRDTAWSRVVFKFHHVLTVLKLIQLSISGYRLSQSVELSVKSVQSIVAVAAMSSAYLTALVWSCEFAKYSDEVIILLSPLRKINLDAGSDGSVADQERASNRRKKRNQFAQKHHEFSSYLKAVARDFFRHMATFSIHEFLTIMVPIVVALFLPVIDIIILIGQPKEVLVVSLLTPDSKYFGALWAGAVIYDLILITFIVMNFQYGFFLLCSAMAVYLRELRDMERCSRWSSNGVMSVWKRQQMWKQIRRLTIIFNIINKAGCNCFYMGKLMTFSCCVLGTYYILRFGFTDVVSFGIGLLACEGIMFYVLCLGNAYLITDTTKSVLHNLKLMLQSLAGNSKRELKQRIKSVKPLGFMEGGFREMSQETTPEFVDFYLNQVIGLLLTF